MMNHWNAHTEGNEEMGKWTFRCLWEDEKRGARI